MNGFGKFGDFLGMGSCDAPVAVFSDGDRYSGRERQAHAQNYHALSRREQEKPLRDASRRSYHDKDRRPFTDLFDTLFA